ncbi:L-histidine N(alpha)-methyltransferase [Microscilla marina]|uniref:Histidine-specific methyltransferase SAM-dependent domain-containing protein n=1 Tax=Microscilla marina ATCC 23134 TaxID=313606 RepID=A1ZPA5_MICM2|nr:L-histidine N(alpha)-methyltransferase [Microscilla marina]EAY27897.1 conserved hypothetical protein [Microscilla marina ATCC 23134]
METTAEVLNDTFATDVIEGLSSTPKFLSSKYFYDEKGDAIFQQIMDMPSYYLTKSEHEIFNTHKQALLSLFSDRQQAFHLIEFGAGDGMKTKVLLEHFLQQKACFRYLPIDISENVLSILVNDLEINFPGLEVEPLANEYFEALDILNEQQRTERKIILFLGSNIGNFLHNEAIEFLRQMRKHLRPDDLLLIGFDLKKDPQIILDAYNDKEGITRNFNLNLLDRINAAFDGNFDTSQFIHSPTYNPLTGATKSYLVSTKDQEVTLERLGKTFKFEAWEAIDMEISQKYSLSNIEHLAKQAGFEVMSNFFDKNKNFVDSVWTMK